MKNILTLISKALISVLALICLDLTSRYTIEQLGILNVQPSTVPKYTHRHLINVLQWVPLVFAYVGWVYGLAIFLHYKIVQQIGSSWKSNIIAGIIISNVLFTIYWLLAENHHKINSLIEGFIVYTIIGCILATLQKLLFKKELTKIA